MNMLVLGHAGQPWLLHLKCFWAGLAVSFRPQSSFGDKLPPTRGPTRALWKRSPGGQWCCMASIWANSRLLQLLAVCHWMQKICKKTNFGDAERDRFITKLQAVKLQLACVYMHVHPEQGTSKWSKYKNTTADTLLLIRVLIWAV